MGLMLKIMNIAAATPHRVRSFHTGIDGLVLDFITFMLAFWYPGEDGIRTDIGASLFSSLCRKVYLPHTLFRAELYKHG